MTSDYLCGSCGVMTSRIGAQFCTNCGALLLLNQRYRLIAKIGEGRFSTDYKAEDCNLGNALRAVKAMRVQSQDPLEVQQAKASFQQKAGLLATLSHPSLPQVYAHFEQSDRSYLVMEYIEGQTLEDYLTKTPGGKLPLQEVLEIGIQLCTVLHYLHMHQPSFIFGDLEPANVMRTSDGRLYLVGFGIALLFKPGEKEESAATDSPGFTAPEQHCKEQATARADMYDLGATLYTLLSERDSSEKPYQFPPLDLTQDAPAGPVMAKLVGRMLNLDEQKRPPSMKVIQQDLERLLQQLKASARKSEQWRICEEKWRSQYILIGKVVHVRKSHKKLHGLLVDIEGIRGVWGFVPLSQLANHGKNPPTEKDLDNLVGSTLQLKIKEIDPTQKRLILSERLAVKNIAGGGNSASTSQASSASKTSGTHTSESTPTPLSISPLPSTVDSFTNSPGSFSQHAFPVEQNTQASQRDERCSLGNEAEEQAWQILRARLNGRKEGAILPCPVLLMPAGGFQESDCLVYTGGILFCLEAKNWSGRVTYAPRYRIVQLPGGTGTPQQPLDYSHVLFQSRDAPERIHENPLEKTRHFVHDLKAYLNRIDPRFHQLFQQFPVISVVAFTNRADIGVIHDFQEGIIFMNELDEFFDHKIQHYNPSSSPSLPWVEVTIANKVPNWDRILMKTQTTWLRGVLVGQLTYTGIDGRDYQLPSYLTICSIAWQKTGERCCSGKEIYEMTVSYKDQSPRIYRCVNGKVSLARTPCTSARVYEIQNLQNLTVGLANKEI